MLELTQAACILHASLLIQSLGALPSKVHTPRCLFSSFPKTKAVEVRKEKVGELQANAELRRRWLLQQVKINYWRGTADWGLCSQRAQQLSEPSSAVF